MFVCRLDVSICRLELIFNLLSSVFVFQADGLSALVAGAHDACARAEELNASLASTFHKESFRAFPHVDSPQTLIRQLAAQTPAR